MASPGIRRLVLDSFSGDPIDTRPANQYLKASNVEHVDASGRDRAESGVRRPDENHNSPQSNFGAVVDGPRRRPRGYNADHHPLGLMGTSTPRTETRRMRSCRHTIFLSSARDRCHGCLHMQDTQACQACRISLCPHCRDVLTLRRAGS